LRHPVSFTFLAGLSIAIGEPCTGGCDGDVWTCVSRQLVCGNEHPCGGCDADLPLPGTACSGRCGVYICGDEPGTVEHAVWQSIYALEDVLKQERGKTIMLSRTRQKIGRSGEIQCIADIVLGAPSEGFRMLLERDLLELSFEAVALQFSEKFNVEVLEAAKARLCDAGYLSQESM
jgi:hypothetical protein